MQTYKGREYAPDSAVATAVDLHLEGDSLYAKANVYGGQSGLEKIGKLHLNDFEIEVGGFTSMCAMLTYVPSKTTIVVEQGAPLLDAIARTKAPIAQKAARASAQIKGAPKKVAYTWGMVVVSSFAAVAIAYFTIEGIVNYIADVMPASVERMIADGYLLLSHGQFDRIDSPSQRRVDRIAARLLSNLKDSPYSFDIRVVDNPDINAQSLPGGVILVFSGLIDQVSSDHELAGVLGHEIGHVTRKHALRGLLHAIGIGNCVKIYFYGISPQLSEIMSKAADLDSLNYSRVQEFQADKIGTHLAYEADYNPRGIITFFERAEKELGDNNNKFHELLSTHPMPAERAVRVNQEVERMEHERIAKHRLKSAQ